MPIVVYVNAVLASFRQQWKVLWTFGSITNSLVGALGPGVVVGWIVGRSGNDVALPYIFVGAPLMMIWSLGGFRTGWSLADEHFQGTLELMMTTRTPLALVMLGKVLAIMTFIGAFASASIFLIVLAFARDLPSVEAYGALAVSISIAVVGVIALAFMFSPFLFLLGNRGDILMGISPLGTVLSGFFYPIGTLPAAVEVVSRLLPAAWAMEAVVRSIEGEALGRTAVDWAIALGLIVALLGLTTLMFAKAERMVRVSGSLATG